MSTHISAFDRAHVYEILNGYGDWFGAHLLRLIAKADPDNRAALRLGFPDYVEAYETWLHHIPDLLAESGAEE